MKAMLTESLRPSFNLIGTHQIHFEATALQESPACVEIRFKLVCKYSKEKKEKKGELNPNCCRSLEPLRHSSVRPAEQNLQVHA